MSKHNRLKLFMQPVLLGLVAVSLGVFAWQRIAPGGGADGVDAARAAGGMPQEAAVVVTYFTTDQRCTACLQIEALTRATLEETFAAELDQGRIRFQTHNLDRPENRHFARDYGLAFKTVVVSDYESGQEVEWRKMDEVWRLLSRPEAFKAYLATQVYSYLET